MQQAPTKPLYAVARASPRPNHPLYAKFGDNEEAKSFLDYLFAAQPKNAGYISDLQDEPLPPLPPNAKIDAAFMKDNHGFPERYYGPPVGGHTFLVLNRNLLKFPAKDIKPFALGLVGPDDPTLLNQAEAFLTEFKRVLEDQAKVWCNTYAYNVKAPQIAKEFPDLHKAVNYEPITRYGQLRKVWNMAIPTPPIAHALFRFHYDITFRDADLLSADAFNKALELGIWFQLNDSIRDFKVNSDGRKTPMVNPVVSWFKRKYAENQRTPVYRKSAHSMTLNKTNANGARGNFDFDKHVKTLDKNKRKAFEDRMEAEKVTVSIGACISLCAGIIFLAWKPQTYPFFL